MGITSKSFEKKVILFKTETTEGTDAAPAVATDAFQVLNYQPNFMDADGKVRNLEKAYFGANPVALSAFKRGATFDLEMHGSGGLATAKPQWMRLLQYAGFNAGTVGASNVIQSPISDNLPSATHWGYLDDLLMKAVGGKMSVGFTIEDDEYPLFNVTYLGRPPTALAEEAVPGAVTLTGLDTPVISSTENTTFSLDGFALPLRRIQMAANADLQLRSLIGPQDKIAYRNRSWSGQIVGELPTLTDKDYFAKVRPRTTMACAITQGSGTGKTVAIAMPKIQITGNVEISEEQGKVMFTMPVTALPNTGNDEVVFTTS